uniref:protein-serine/threonine phosphatase n=1 Tax=Glossina palpalis gambiensis TaxID=67801 RepID=A0A1B0AMH1_9MUSC
MGAYLSQPKTEKESTDESNDYLMVGACSMQGWRNSQEDAHNSILTYDTNASFFAVYDGHGGAEVSTYCSDKFPAFLKTLATYQEGAFEQALKDAFLGFDKTLLDSEVIELLKIIAGEKNFGHNEDSDTKEDDDDEDLAELHEEGNLPLDEVMKKYKGHPSMPVLKKLKENSSPKPQSPYLRGRRAAAIIADAANKAVLDPDSKPEGSSTSKAALAAEQTESPSSTKFGMENDSSNSNSAEAEAKTTSPQSSVKDKVANGSVTLKTRVKESEQNGSVSSSETKADEHDKPTTRSEKGANDRAISNEADCEPKQNGNITDGDDKEVSIEKSEANDTAITSTSKEVKEKKKVIPVDSSEEEDADFDDAGYDEEEESGEDEDEETFLANENFCANMIEEPGKDSGCTAVVSLLVGRDLYVANAGDSRCVVCRNGKAIEMSLDHKPEDDEESARIMKAGGTVTIDGRVNGGLNLSRAIGDHGYKMNANLPAEEQMISALPDVKKLIVTPEDEFMVLACDGIWNFMSSEEVVNFVRLRIKDKNKKISQICEELFDACLAPNTMGDGTGCDNMTAVIVRFKPALLELPTKINANETEDVLQARQQQQEQQQKQSEAESTAKKVQKRAIALTTSNDDCCEAESKRMKTDDNDDIDTTAASNKDRQFSSNVSDVTTNSNCSSSSASSSLEDKKENEIEDISVNEAQAVSNASST